MRDNFSTQEVENILKGMIEASRDGVVPPILTGFKVAFENSNSLNPLYSEGYIQGAEDMARLLLDSMDKVIPSVIDSLIRS